MTPRRAVIVVAVALVCPTPVHADVLGDQLRRFDDGAKHRRRIIAVVTGSVGAASVAVGIAHGIGALADWHDLQHSNLCDAAHVCNAEGVRLTDRTNGLARAADLLIGSGLVVIGAAAAIWLSARDVEIAPVLTPDSAGAIVRGRF